MRKVVYVLLLLLGVQCREKYEAVLPPTETHVLVVEGVVNLNGPTDIRLSRTAKLSETGIVAETGAVVMVEGESGSSYQLTPLSDGHYVSDQVPLDPTSKYRLRIITENSKEYQSELREVIPTQQIDSISYQLQGDIVQFFINSNDDKQKKYYFKWDIEETWQIVSPFVSNLKFFLEPSGDSVIVTRVDYANASHTIDESIHVCWQSAKSSNINIGSTEQLSESHIFLPVKALPRNSIQLGAMYSMLVKQFALSADGYDFYRRMKKNSESLGSIFDAQPSEITGNIKCTSDPAELVIGFVEFTTEQQKRIFIRSEDIPGIPYDQGCSSFGSQGAGPYMYPFEDGQQIMTYVYKVLRLLPTRYVKLPGPGGPATFQAEADTCVDCTLRGSNVKPDFWP